MLNTVSTLSRQAFKLSLWLLVFALSLFLAACGGGGGGGGGAGKTTIPPLTQLIQAEDELYGNAQTLLEEGVAAFQDLMPQALATKATNTFRPLTLAQDGERNIVLVGSPWRLPWPFPWPPWPPRPILIVIEVPPSGKPTAKLAFLRQEEDGSYTLEWHGRKGVAPIRVPARVERIGDLEGIVSGRRIVFSYKHYPNCTKEYDLIIEFRAEGGGSGTLHIIGSMPSDDSLPGRELSGALSTSGYEQKIRDICCGRPRPWPPDWPPLILIREDVSVAVVPYDNPNLNVSNIEELVGQDLGFMYIRRKPFPGGSTDCGPNGVWCPPEDDFFMNVRLVRLTSGGYGVELRRLGSQQPIVTLPARPILNSYPPGISASIGIVDDLADPESPTLEFWMRQRKDGITITITITIKIGK